MGEDRGKPVAHHRTCAREVPGPRRQSTAHHHQAIGVKGRRRVDRAQIVLDRTPATFGVGRREHAAPAHPRDMQPGIADRPCRRCHSHVGEDIPPRGNAANAMPCAALDTCSEVPFLAHRHGVERQLPRWRHHWTPCRASSVRIRVIAKSGSRSTPARSASRNSSAKCSMERADCCPPTITKWS